MAVLAISLLALVAVVCGGIQRKESINFPVGDCSRDNMDFLFLYSDARDKQDRQLQTSLASNFTSDINQSSPTHQLQYAEVYDSFSASEPDVNVSSWRFQTSIASAEDRLDELRVKGTYYKTVKETISLKVTFVKRLFAEMGGVRESTTHVAVVFLDGHRLSFEESRSVPDIVQQQDTDIKIFVIVFGLREEKNLAYIKDTLLFGKQHKWVSRHVFMMAVCGQCATKWLQYKSLKTHYISCYAMSAMYDDPKMNWNKAADVCRQHGGSLVTIETEEEFKFVSRGLFRTNKTIFIGLKKNPRYFARRFHWSQTWSGQTRPLVLHHWLPGKPSGGLGSWCGMWNLVLNKPMSGGRSLSIRDPHVTATWEDVNCDNYYADAGVCEVELPGRVVDRNSLSIKPANKEKLNRALGKGYFIVFRTNLVSVSASIASTYFVDGFNQTIRDSIPLFDCGMGIPDPRYISYLFVCDKVDHCSNRRDEMFCVYKPRDPVKCGGVSCCDGYCLPLHRVGDGVVDCQVCDSVKSSVVDDESEDLVKSLKTNKYCALFCNDNGGCVDFSELNDSKRDCTGPDGALDETIGKVETVDTCQNILGHRVWAPRCVYVRDRYGAVLGCRDMSHLKNCTDFECQEGYFKCPNTYCIPQHYVLDGTADCPAGEEENIDTIAPCTGNFACWDSKVCLHPDLVCDGHPDCPHQDDEVDCRLTCPKGLHCISGTATVHDYSGFVNIHSLNILDSSLRYLDLSRVDLSISSFSFLSGLISLQVLICSKCNIHALNDAFIEHTHGLQTLDLSYNRIKILDGRASYDPPLENIRHLNLSNNRELSAVTNLPLRFLETLDLSHTSLSQLGESDLASFPSLKHLNLSFTKITNIHKNTFPSRLILLTLDLHGLALKDFREDFFNGLTVSQDLYTDSFELCCPQVRGPNIPDHACHAPDDKISSCSDLVGVDVQLVLLWVVAVLAVLGNMTVIVYRVIWDRSVLRTGYGLFVTNLGISDFIMGVYLLIIAGADYYYRGVYVISDKSWREGGVCRLAGFLATLSCETSTFFVFLITLDRFLVMKFPFGENSFSKLTKIILLPLSWIIGFLLALSPIVFQFEIYSSNAMCLGLPLTIERLKGWEFSFAVFIVLNFCLFLFIAYGQRAIFQAMSENRKTQTLSRRAQDITVAQQLSLVALSNFLCWFPVGLIGLLSLGGHEISNDVYAWITVVVLPINSAANPLLYTIPALMAKWERFKHGETRPTQISVS